MTTVRGGESNSAANGSENQASMQQQNRTNLNGSVDAYGELGLEDELAEILENPDSPNSPQLPPQTMIEPQESLETSVSNSDTSSFVNKLLNSQSIALARKLGYGLLIISLIDFIFIFIPPQFLNPVWEYKIIGDIIKLVPLPMFALLLIFVGERTNRRPLEKLPLKILSWMTLVTAIFFFLLLPLIITDYVRIDRFNNSQISNEINLQKRKLTATLEQVAQLNAQQIEDLIPKREDNGTIGSIPETPEEARENIVNNIERAKSQADERATNARKNVTLNLTKNSVKLFLQSLLAAVLYLLLWTSTKWARISKSKRKRRRRN